jgi:hypothetical protein
MGAGRNSATDNDQYRVPIVEGTGVLKRSVSVAHNKKPLTVRRPGAFSIAVDHSFVNRPSMPPVPSNARSM